MQSIIYRCGSRPRSKHLLQFLTDAESGLGTWNSHQERSGLQCGEDREDGKRDSEPRLVAQSVVFKNHTEKKGFNMV